MKTRLFIILSSLVVLAGAGAITWYLAVSPGGGQTAETAAASAASDQEELVQTAETTTEPPVIPDNNGGLKEVSIATEVPALVTVEAGTAETGLPATGSQPTETQATKAEPGTTQSPQVQLAEPTATQPAEPKPTAASTVEVQEAGVQANDAPPSDTMPAESAPVVIRQGQFRDGDAVHKGSGTATISQKPDGSYLLSFEDFAVCCGPDLYVFLASNPSPTSHADLGDYLELSSLEASSGDQTYEISADTDLSEINSIVIYCKPFQVIISAATLG